MSEETNNLTRRGFIAATMTAAVGLAAGGTFGAPQKSDPVAVSSVKNRSVRFAHFTDIHLDPKRNAPEGLTAALHHAQSLPDKPDMIITGGDNIMDSLGADDNWTEVQYKLLKKVFAEECKLPVKFCVGNHDVWGWDKKNSKTKCALSWTIAQHR